MSENVKIKITEHDKTSPAGNGIDSTDIAFIPGFSILPNAPKNKPTLVTTTREFEKIFGVRPRVLTNADVKDYTSYGFKSGDFDRSYVYAKELLFQGMPILYSNIVADDLYADTLELDPESTSGGANVTWEVKDNKIICIAAGDVNADIEVTTKINIQTPSTKNNTPAVKTYEFVAEGENCHINSFTTSPSELKLEFSEVTVYEGHDTIVEFTNSTDISEDVQLPCTIKLSINLKKGSKATITLKEKSGSLLDGFYKSTDNGLKIDEQWEISTTENPLNDTISDKSVYSVKYITSGGYPSVVSNDNKSATQKFATKMLAAAAHRGDAVALIDYQLAPEEKVFAVGKDAESVYAKMHAAFNDVSNASFGAAMYPWSTYNCGSSLSFTDNQVIEMPASFGYLMCVAKAIKSSPNWLAMAGVTRGLVPGISKLLVPQNVISNAIAEEMQPKFGVDNHKLSINTITNIRPYGLTLWGNRTLMPVSNEGTVALNFLNTRNMLSDIKKLLYTTAKSCMFEQNSTDLWVKFKGGIEPLLKRLKAGNGISDYQIVRGTTKYNGDPLTKGEVAAVIKIYPMYAVEYFELAVEINDEEVTVS